MPAGGVGERSPPGPGRWEGPPRPARPPAPFLALWKLTALESPPQIPGGQWPGVCGVSGPQAPGWTSQGGQLGWQLSPSPAVGGGGGGSPGRRQRWVSGAQPGLGVDPGCAPAPGVPGGGSLPRSSGEEVVGEGREPPGGAAPEPLGPGGPSQVRAAECKAPAPRALTQHLPEPCSRGGTKRPLKAAGSRRSPFGPPVMSTRVQVRTALPLSAAVGAALWSTGWAAGWALPGSFLERPWQDRWGSTCMSLPGSRAPDP